MSEPETTFTLPLGVEDISKLLPHRYPFLLLDRIVAFERDRRVTAIKNVTTNEPFFQGHFPGHPVMPGVLVVEAMAQASCILTKLSRPPEPTNPYAFYLVKVDRARFTRVVVPGDQLRMEVEQKRTVRNMSQFWAQAFVDGQVAAEAEILCAEVRR